jgi:hypothetical protein
LYVRTVLVPQVPVRMRLEKTLLAIEGEAGRALSGEWSLWTPEDARRLIQFAKSGDYTSYLLETGYELGYMLELLEPIITNENIRREARRWLNGRAERS